MRIISGKYGGRRINPPGKMPHTRPTTDIAKEGLFNIISNQLNLEGIDTLDLFGGTGSITYELASRGAAHCTIVEKDPAMYGFIVNTARMLGIENLRAFKMDVFNFLNSANSKYDLIFAGPPYALGPIDELPRLIVKRELLKENGWFILEHTPRNNYKDFEFFRAERNYGTTLFSIFVNG